MSQTRSLSMPPKASLHSGTQDQQNLHIGLSQNDWMLFSCSELPLRFRSPMASLTCRLTYLRWRWRYVMPATLVDVRSCLCRTFAGSVGGGSPLAPGGPTGWRLPHALEQPECAASEGLEKVLELTGNLENKSILPIKRATSISYNQWMWQR